MTEQRRIIARGMRSEIIIWGPGQVLKLYELARSRAAVAAEAEATAMAFDLGLPVPRVYETVEIEGRHGIVLEQIEGPSLDELLNTIPWAGPRLIRSLARVQADINRLQAPTADSLKDQLAAKINSPRSPLSLPDKAAVSAVLAGVPDGDNICHGDLHPRNVIVCPKRGPIVIDWDSPSRGQPLGDVARTYLIMRHGHLHAPPLLRPAVWGLTRMLSRVYLQAYREAAGLQALEGSGAGDWATWLWLHAAARLCEGIGVEKAPLLAMVRSGLAAEAARNGRAS